MNRSHTATTIKVSIGHGGRQEGGFILVLSLLILFSLTLIGMTSIINATIDTKIAANENNANRALYAADSGLAHSLTLLNNGALAPVYTDPAWVYPVSGAGTETDGGIVYQKLALDPRSTLGRWHMQFKKDTEDLDTDGNTTEVVYFNRHFHYNKSLYTGSPTAGFPVIEVVSEGIISSGGGSADPRLAEKRLALEIGRNMYSVRVEGAVTSNSNANFTGNFAASGKAHNINGADCNTNPSPPCSCTDEKPAVFLDTGMVANINKPGNFTGSPSSTQVNPDARSMPRTPWEALGISEADAPPQTAPATLLATNSFTGMVWANASINIDNGNGILIVHNPLFDAVIWACSQSGLTYDNAIPNRSTNSCFEADKTTRVTATYDPKLDSSSAQYDAAYKNARAPAKFGANSNGTIKGVVIADSVDKLNGTVEIIGAVISLTEVEAGIFGNGTADINFSCDAINQSAQVGYSTKLVWRRL